MTERITFAFAGVAPQMDATHAIYPMSLLFRAGEYQDKRYAMTAGEIKAAVEHFTPVGGNIEHTRFLQGRACEVRRVWADGDTMRGEVAVPLGLDALLTDDERKLSCEWDRNTKTLSGMALCMNPRVHDAALMSLDADDTALFAGARHSKDDIALIDRIAALLTQLRDAEVAEDKEETTEGEATMTGTAARFALQEGWTYGDQRTFLESELQEDFGGGEPYSIWLRDFDDTTVIYSAQDGSYQQRTYEIVENDAKWGEAREVVAHTSYEPVVEATTMSNDRTIRDTLLALLTGRDPQTPPVAATPPARAEEPAQMSTTPQETPREKELRERLERAEHSLAAMSAQGIRTRAEDYAEQVITASRAVPAQRTALAALFAQVLADDAAHAATVTFGEGEAGTGGRTEALIAVFRNAVPHGLTVEAVPENVILFGEPRTGGHAASDARAEADADAKAAAEWMKGQQRTS